MKIALLVIWSGNLLDFIKFVPFLVLRVVRQTRKIRFVVPVHFNAGLIITAGVCCVSPWFSRGRGAPRPYPVPTSGCDDKIIEILCQSGRGGPGGRGCMPESFRPARGTASLPSGCASNGWWFCSIEKYRR
jgi:hypothetical protein